MVSGTLVNIILGEALVVAIVIAGVLWFQNRKLKQRMGALGKQIKDLRSKLAVPPPAAGPPPEQEEKSNSYRDCLLTHIQNTKAYHGAFDDKSDIALDIDPETPEHRRVTALRYAVLIAESEAATAGAETDWEALNARYGQLLKFLDDYRPATADIDITMPVDASKPVDAGKFAENITKSEQNLDELTNLKELVEDQSKLIEELLGDFTPQPDAETQKKMIDKLNMELVKQQKLLEQSHKIIDSLKTELLSTKKLMAELTARASETTKLKTENTELWKRIDGYEQITTNLTLKNEELTEQLNG